MRYRLAAFLFASAALLTPAGAETQVFLLDGNDGYGIDRCLAAGERCGEAAAVALCRTRNFETALNFGRVDRREITGGNGIGTRVAHCEGASCPETVAITCSR
jgi:hypothetical protein